MPRLGGMRAHANRFVQTFSGKIKLNFHKPLHEVVIAAAFLIYGEEYSASQVTTLVNGRAKSKLCKVS